uniref:Uncharacterized protein n=1 Tax=Parascaris univalens TaxID=6257 RepID=A0A915BA51_PARUN
MFCCCGVDSDVSANSSEPYEAPRGDPVVIEPLPDVSTLRSSHASTNAAAHAGPILPLNNSETFVGAGELQEHSKKVSPTLNAPTKRGATDGIDTQGAMDECLSKRAYILGISDDELQLLPFLFIESFYPCLSPGEVVQLEQRLCDLQAKCSPKKEELNKQIPAPSEKFMRSLRAQISLRNENGFWIDDEIGTQSGLDVRDIILTAGDEEIATLSQETLAILKPYLSIAELEDVQERIQLVQIAHRAKKIAEDVMEPLNPSPEHITEISQPFQPPPVNSKIYHLTATPSISVEPAAHEHNTTVDPNMPRHHPPLICVSDVDAVLPHNDVEEETVRKIVDDVFDNI